MRELMRYIIVSFLSLIIATPVLLVMNPKGVESLLRSKVKLGADAAVAAGPKGRDAMAATDAYMRAEILAYSRSRGLFAGVSLEGSTLRQDNKANERLYGRKITAREIVRSGKGSGQRLVSVLQKASPRNQSNPSSLHSTEKTTKRKTAKNGKRATFTNPGPTDDSILRRISRANA